MKKNRESHRPAGSRGTVRVQTEEARSPVMQETLNQSNHESYVIPRSVMSWTGEPLYLLVARWCLLQDRWVNRNDIARAFHLPARRASFQLSYISRKKARVQCRTRYRPDGEGGRCRYAELRVEQVFPPPVGESCSRSSSCSGAPRKATRATGSVSPRVGSGMAGNGGLWEALLRRVREGKDE